MNKPHFYYLDVENYNDDFLREIITWQKWQIEELQKFNEIKKNTILEGIEDKITFDEIDKIFQKQISILKQKYNNKQFLSNKQGKLYGIMSELNKIRKIIMEKKYV